MKRELKRIMILSIWEDIWELGEESGPSDEYHFIRYLTEKGIELHFLVPEPPDGLPGSENRLLTYHTYPNVFRKLARYPRPLQRLARVFAAPRTMLKSARELMGVIDPDIVIGFSYYSLYPLSRLGSEFDIPTVNKLFGTMYLDHTGMGFLKYWWYNYEQIAFLRFPADHYIVLNDGTMGERALMRRGIAPERISFLPNGMDMEWLEQRVDPARARSELGLPADSVIVSTLSRLVRSKRVDLFIEAVSRIEPRLLERTTVLIGGDGPEREYLERRAGVLGLGERVVFTGTMRRSELPFFFGASDIFVATNELTNMSLPPCEAVLCGVPVVAFDVCGTSEVIREGVSGLLTEDGDIEGLARKIGLLIEDEEMRKELGRSAARFGEKHFIGWDERVGRELEVLERVLLDRTGFRRDA